MAGVGGESAASGEAELVEALILVVSGALTLEPSIAVCYAQRAQREFAAVEATMMAELDDRERRRAANAGGTRSRKETAKASKRSKAVNDNPKLGSKLASGDIGQEQLDAIADASEKSGGDAANDETLLDDIENAKPDDANKITERWLQDRNDQDSAQSRFDRQNERRGVSKGHDKATGCDTLILRGPTEKIDELKKKAAVRAGEMYEADGGRDLSPDEHPRTHQQRMFDAAYEILTGSGTSASEASRTSPRSMIHVSLVVDAEAEAEIRATCPDGSGYLPASVFDRYGCGAMIGGTVFSESGEILWHGRQRRYATPAQFTALVARDGGCVLCGRGPEFCQAHHMVPFNAPAQGETNIDELALMCSSCHGWLHDSNRTLIFSHKPPNSGHRGDGDDADGSDAIAGERHCSTCSVRVWKTRPATPNETPAPKPGNNKRKRPETTSPRGRTSPARR